MTARGFLAGEQRRAVDVPLRDLARRSLGQLVHDDDAARVLVRGQTFARERLHRLGVDAVMALASRILVLHHGAAIAEGAPAEVTRDRAVIDSYLGAEAI